MLAPRHASWIALAVLVLAVPATVGSAPKPRCLGFPATIVGTPATTSSPAPGTAP